jgi:hypothetical protein
MVDTNGKPYQNQNQNNRVNKVAEQPIAVAAAASLLLPRLDTRMPSLAQLPTSARIVI